MTTQRAVDWDRLLGDLAWLLGEPDPARPQERRVLSDQQLAAWLKVPRMTMVGWRNGQQPRHPVGEQLIDHWCRLSSKRREFVPLTVLALSAAKVR